MHSIARIEINTHKKKCTRVASRIIIYHKAEQFNDVNETHYNYLGQLSMVDYIVNSLVVMYVNSSSGRSSHHYT